MNLKSLKVRILVSFSALIFTFFLFTLYNFNINDDMEKQTKALVEEDLVVLNVSEQLVSVSSARLSAALGYVLMGEPSYVDVFHSYETQLQDYSDQLVAYSQNDAKLQELIALEREWSALVSKDVFSVYEAGNIELARNNLTAATPMISEVLSGFAEIASARKDAMHASGDDVVEQSRQTKMVTVIVSLFVMLLGVAIALFTATMIARPINQVAARMEQLAAGDLTQQPLSTRREDEIGSLMYSANKLNEQLHVTITSISAAASTVASSSAELAQSATEVGQGAEQISHTLQELEVGTDNQANAAADLSNTMHLFAQKIAHTTEEGFELQKSSENVQQLTSTGQQLMKSSTNQMAVINDLMLDSVQKVEGLNAQSAEISKLVSVIDAISTQTNLLALNAAIEAARAGDAGKGFAVVADEVRKLAEQVQLSVADISEIVSRIQGETSNVTASLQAGYKEVQSGTAQIAETSTTFDEISEAVHDMLENIETISSNLSTVLTSSSDISHSIHDIASISEQSAAAVEETAATTEQASSTMEEITSQAHRLAELADRLNIDVRHFKLHEND